MQLEGLSGSLITGEVEILGGMAVLVSWPLKSFAAQGRVKAKPQAAIPTVEVAHSYIVENKLYGQNNTWTRGSRLPRKDKQ